MLCEDKIIALYCIVDNLVKGIGHKEDVRRKVSDSEVITTALCVLSLFWWSSGQCQTLYANDKDDSRHA